MTIITESDGRLTTLHARAAADGGDALADALREVVEDAKAMRRAQDRGAYAVPPGGKQRDEVQRIFEAAAALLGALWVPVESDDDNERRRARPAVLLTGHKPLLTRLDDDLTALLALAEQHARGLPATKPPDHVRDAILTNVRAVLAAHGVPFKATATRSEYSRREYTSLAVDAVMLALDLSAAAARKAIRDHLKRTGTDSTAY